MLARAFERTKQTGKARDSYERGVGSSDFARPPRNGQKNIGRFWKVSSQCRRHEMFIVPEVPFLASPFMGDTSISPLTALKII